MVKREQTERPTLDKLVGHYRAFDGEKAVLWEKKDFCVSVDMIPPGLSLGMKAATITKDGKVVRKWDPWGLL